MEKELTTEETIAQLKIRGYDLARQLSMLDEKRQQVVAQINQIDKAVDELLIKSNKKEETA